MAVVFLLYNGWRYCYFGDILPNTYYVKGGGGWCNFRLGWLNIKRLWSFNYNGFFISLAPLALIPRRSRRRVACLLAILASYLLYEIKIGGDILPMYRLHLTVLPLQFALASIALQVIWDSFHEVVKEKYLPHLNLLLPLVFLFVLAPKIDHNLGKSMRHIEYRGVRESLDGAHGAIGRYLEREGQDLDVAVSQDMGVMPWNAPSIVFVDTIGLVDRTIAHTHYELGYTPYIRYLLWEDEEARAKIKSMERRLRRYVFSRKPRWFIVNVDVEAQDSELALEALRLRDGDYFAPYVEANAFFYDIASAPEWSHFHFVKGWKYSDVHFLLLYEKRSSSFIGEDDEVYFDGEIPIEDSFE